MELIRPFERLGKSDAGIAGGKGASLGEMMQAGIPVPPGFVILSSAFERFLAEADLNQEIDTILHTVRHDEMHTIEHASEKFRALILGAKMPEDIACEIAAQFLALDSQHVAVRSSATAEDSASAAWAGQLDTFLNTTEEKLLENVQRCWASLFTPRAIFYRFEKDMHKQNISVAVVVQKMVESETSGIAFSVHPVTEDQNQLIIEAGFGLGEAIVSGQVTPNSYVVEKSPRRIIDKNISTQSRALHRGAKGGTEWKDIAEPQASSQALSDEQVLELSNLVLRIETHYGTPQDIEWAFEEGKFFVTQSRPITTLGTKEISVKHFKKEDYFLSLWFQGISVFVADIHVEIYRELEMLCIIDQGMYKQYFTQRAYKQALDRGLAFYSDPKAFDTYRKKLAAHCDVLKDFFESHIRGEPTLRPEVVRTFFEHTKKLCGEYTKMNFEFTDKAFARQDENPTIKKNLAGVAQFKDSIRAFMNTTLFEPDGYSSQCFAILGKQFDIPPAVLDNLTQREILALFEGKRPDESIVEKRQEAFVESYDLESFYEGKDAEDILQEFKETTEHSDTISGQAASKGKVTGTVKIIPVDYSDPSRVNTEIEKMRQGDILVAETTAPELMIACKKAGAIVTDMGGLMSHAAIVSREFKIPCIVGTKNASKILKDGDVVEVDANTGVVKVIERAA